MQNLKLFDMSLYVTDELENYNKIRSHFKQLADEAVTEFSKRYKTFPNIEKVLEGVPVVYGELMSKMIDEAVSLLIAQDYTIGINADQFINNYHNKYAKSRVTIHSAYNAIEERYINILDTEEAKDEYRTARRQGRGKIIGGGFGIEGAVQGMATAGAINLATGAVHGTVNLIGKGFSMAGAAMKKQEIFKDSNTYKSLAEAVYNDCFCVHYTLVDILKSKANVNISYITQSAADKARGLFDNTKNPAFPKDKILEAMVSVLELDPYEEDYYQFLIDSYKDKNGEVEAIANYFDIDVNGYKKLLAYEYFKTLPVATLEEAKDAKEKVTEYSAALGGIPEDLNQEIDDLIDVRKYEKIYGNYNTMPKETLDELHQCREKTVILCNELCPADGGKKILDEIDVLVENCKTDMAMKFFDSLPKATEGEALAAKNRIQDYCREIELGEDNPAIQKIDAVIKQIDKEIRTVEGVEFKTREHASSAKDEKSIIESIIAKHELIFRKDFTALIDEINNYGLKTDLKNVYLRRIEGNLKEFDKKCQKAARHNFMLVNRNPVFNGDTKDMIIQGIVFLICIFGCISGEIFGGIVIAVCFVAYIILFKRRLC